MAFEDITKARYAVNCSILFTELPLERRFDAVRTAGFEAVELWWPFATPVPSEPEVASLERAITDAGVSLIGLNFFAGDMASGDRGVVSSVSRGGAFRDNIDVVVGIGERLGCRAFNALYGNREPDQDPARQDEVAVENLAAATAAVAAIDGVVLIEAVSGAERYPLLTAASAVQVIERVRAASGIENIGLLADLYHLAVNGDDVDRVLDEQRHLISHVQLADSPGRHEPGTGSLPLASQVARLYDDGYRGWVGLEYKPSTGSEDSFAWLPTSRRASADARAE